MSTWTKSAPTELCLRGCPSTFRIFWIPGYQVVAWNALPSSGLSTYSTRIGARAPCAPFCPLWGRVGIKKAQRGNQEQKKAHLRILGLRFYVFPNLTNFLFLFLCLFLPQIFSFSLAIQNSNWVLLDFTYLFHLQHRSCPLHFFLFPGQSSLFGLGHCCIRQAGFPGDDLGEVSSLNTVQLFIHTSQWFLENIGISRCFL